MISAGGRRAAALVLVLSLTGCSEAPLRRGFASDETTTTTAVPSTPRVSTSVEVRMGPPPRPTKDPATYAVPKTALETDGLDVRESATEISSPLLTLCGTQVENDSTARRHRVVTKSTSGASRLEQDIAVFAGNAARSHVENAKCAAEKIATLPTGQTGWCEPKAGGRGACMVLVAGEDVVVSLKLETISVQRAREVVTRLAAATPVK